MLIRPSNWGPFDNQASASLAASYTLPSLLATIPSATHSSHKINPLALAPLNPTASTSASLASLLSSAGTVGFSGTSPSYVAAPQQGASNNLSNTYAFDSQHSSSMAHQQPRQPPMLNMAAAAATQDPQPYSAPPVTQASYFGGSGGGSSVSANSGASVLNYGSNVVLPSPQQSYGSQGQYAVSNFSTQHSFGSHRVHAEVVGLSQHGLHEFHHGPSNAGMDGFLHGFDGGAIVPMKPKRKQVKNACVNCQKACKRCDEARPCSRCYKYGLSATCVDSARKERKRGVKRGPYKRRATTGSTPTTSSNSLPHSTSMLGSSYGQGMLAGSSPHARSASAMSGSVRAESSGGGSSLYEFTDGGHLVNHSQYTSSAPNPTQRGPASLPSGAAMYDSPSVYGREQSHVSMQPPSARPFGNTRNDYDRSGSQYSPQYAASNGISSRYSGISSNNGGSGIPSSAPAGAVNFNGNSSSRVPAVTAPGVFSPSSSQQGQHLLSAQHHRVSSDNSLATLSATAMTNTSSISPRTPTGSNGNDMSSMHTGEKASYPHQSSSATLGHMNGSAAGAFGHPPHSGSDNHGATSAGSTPQQFPLHLPSNPRARHGSGHNSASGMSQQDERSRPASRQDSMMLYTSSDAKAYADAGSAARYQLPTPRSGSGENRPRHIVTKLEPTVADMTAYGTTA